MSFSPRQYETDDVGERDAVRLQHGLDDAPVGQAQLGDPGGGRRDQETPPPRVRHRLNRG